LVEAWKRDKLLPINGRTITLAQHTYNGLSPEAAQSACQSVVADKPFLVGGSSLRTTALGSPGQCLTQQNHMLTVDGAVIGTQAFLKSVAPLAWQLQPTADTDYSNWPTWLNGHGLLKGKTVCMYSPDDSVIPGEQEVLDTSFRAHLHQLGYKLTLDLTYGTAQSDAVAVSRFRQSNCTVALILGALTEPSGFQNAAEQQGYRPAYPIAEITVETDDSVAAISYNAAAENGNFAMKTAFWSWSKRSPATPKDNPEAAYCLKAYSTYEKKTLDVYDNDAEIQYTLQMCSILEVARQAIINAGPVLTQNSFVAGMEKIHGMGTSSQRSVTFGRNKHAGADFFTDMRFDSNRHQPSNNLWGVISGYRRWYLGDYGS
jgi:hypothetical protein